MNIPFNKTDGRPIPLKDGSRILVIGGGPAGSFFAIHMLRAAAAAGLNIDITLLERKPLAFSGALQPGPLSCNYCAGLISPVLHEKMQAVGLKLPREVVMETYSYLWFHGLWKNFPLKIPDKLAMVSVFRGMHPGRSGRLTARGFDGFLLERAVEAGAEWMNGQAVGIRQTPSGLLESSIRTPSGKRLELECDFAVIATGLNAKGKGNGETDPFFTTFKTLNPAYVPPETKRALIVELGVGRNYLKTYMDKEIYFVESGAADLDLEHIAMIPKRDVLTLALVGKGVERPLDFREAGKQVQRLLSLPHIRTILPGIDREHPKLLCTCSPLMAVKPSRSPLGNRFACIGDALGSRLYKDGLLSAFVTAQALAQTLVSQGLDQHSLSRGFDPVIRWLEDEARYGRRVFRILRMASRSPMFGRILYQAFATEMKFNPAGKWPLGTVLWNIGSGSSDHGTIYREFFSRGVIKSLVTGTLRTFRNILAEKFFGISWNDFGRYPTVILSDQRDAFRKAIETPLGIHLDPLPDMERMYAIKIRAPAEIISTELGKFGEDGSPFMKLRFIRVFRTEGDANVPGSVVRYQLGRLPLKMDVRLVRVVHGRSFLYEPGELFSKQGKLIFDIRSTRDGNNRLVIYTAFNFKTGTSLPGRLFWGVFKKLFPDWVHDVVWNHALCTIKSEAERHDQI